MRIQAVLRYVIFNNRCTSGTPNVLQLRRTNDATTVLITVREMGSPSNSVDLLRRDIMYYEYSIGRYFQSL